MEHRFPGSAIPFLKLKETPDLIILITMNKDLLLTKRSNVMTSALNLSGSELRHQTVPSNITQKVQHEYTANFPATVCGQFKNYITVADIHSAEFTGTTKS